MPVRLRRKIRRSLTDTLLLFFIFIGVVQAGSGLPDAVHPHRGPTPAIPQIAIIIDDMGRTLGEGERVLALPGPVACSFLPYEPHTKDLAELAHLQGNEIMLHQPMQTMASRILDKGGMTLHMDEEQLRARLDTNLAQVPYVIGLNNHMGSLLTQHPGHMAWLMHALKDEHPSLFFVDSRTTKKTVARQLAYENGIPSVSRDVFLDAFVTEKSVREQWDRLIKLAQQQGSAIAIGHPHDVTLKVLKEKLATLDKAQVRLVPVSELVKQQYARDTSWQLSSSH